MDIALWSTNIEPRLMFGRMLSADTFSMIWLLPAFLNLGIMGYVIIKLQVKNEDVCEHLVQGFASQQEMKDIYPELRD